MTTLNITGQAILSIISTGFWAGGRAIHHGTNAYQATRRFHRAQIASGALRSDFFSFINEAQSGLDQVVEDCDNFLNAWQAASDDLRALLVCCLGPIAALLWGAACDVAMGMARTLGRAWGCWMGQARYDLPLALLSQVRWTAAIAAARDFLWTALRGVPAMCDRGFRLAYALT
jgi:hypothetical protein